MGNTSFNTIGTMFLDLCGRPENSGEVAFQHREEKVWVDTLYPQLFEMVQDLAHGFRSIGISHGDRVGITSENRLEWVIADFACTSVGIVDVPVFPILTDEQIEYIFRDAGVTAVICSNAFQLRKVIRASAGIPTLRYIIAMDPDAIDAAAPERRVDRGEGNPPITIFSLHELSERGHETSVASPGLFDEIVRSVDPDDLLTFIYTSGTTGTPKGVMLSHRNMVSNVRGAVTVIPIRTDDVILSYLPLCHAFERMAGYYSGFAMGATIAFAESIDTLASNMLEVRPTFMTTVPRFLERFRERIEAGARKGSDRSQKVFSWAVTTGAKWFDARERNGKAGPLLSMRHAAADRLVFSRIRERTGGRLRCFVSGGAPLSRDVGAFFFAAGIKVIEGYGLTEASPVISANPADRPKLGTVGPPIPGVDVVIAEDGEIMARGENIMLGYHNDVEGTREVITPDGWLHTGDVGEFDEDGYLKITDRKKHLFISSGGKNIAPGPIEERISSLPVVSQVMLLGDNLPFLAALIVPDFDALADRMNRIGSEEFDGTTDDGKIEITTSEKAQDLILRQIRELQTDSAAYERVRRIELLPEEFTVENGLLTPTLKIKRKAVHEAHSTIIEKLYEN